MNFTYGPASYFDLREANSLDLAYIVDHYWLFHSETVQRASQVLKDRA